MDESKQSDLNVQVQAESPDGEEHESEQSLNETGQDTQDFLGSALIRKPKVPLPEGVLRRIDNFNEDLRQQAGRKFKQDTKGEDHGQEFPSLYQRARRWTAKLDEDKQLLNEKSKKNFKLFLLLLLLFGVYFFYTSNFTDNTSLAITALRQKLPIQFDEDTALTKVELTSSELRLYVVKRAQAYAGLDEQAKAEAISALRVNASPLCRNEAMHKIIAEGKRILVLLEADDGSFQREIAIEKCPQTE